MANPYQYTGSGEGFLTDYSGLAGAGSAFQGFAEGYQNALDSKMKRQEQQAQIEALKAKTQREADQTQIDLLKEGMTKDSQGQIAEGPLSQKQKSANMLGAAEKGLRATSFDENGNATGYQFDPKSAKAKEIEASKYRITSGNDFKRETQDRLHDAMDRREHERVLQRLSTNKVATQKLNQYQGLNNALSIITDAHEVTPEQIHEFQQAIRGNMGMKGQSGVGERDETYFKSLGLNAARMKEFLTSDPQSIAKDSKLINHFKQLAAIEQGNIKKQLDSALNSATAGHASMYGRREDLKQDLLDAIQAYKDQVPEATQEAPPPQAQGLMPQRQGLLSRLGGLIFGGSPAAASSSKPKTVIQNGHTYTLNPQTGEYE